MNAQCPGDFDTISGLLGGVDCRVAAYVETAYRGLYGPFGWLGPVLTAALTIYVAVYAYGLITGYGRLSMPGLTRRFLAIGVVVALSSNWAAYQTATADVLAGGGEEIAGRLLGATGGGTTRDVGDRLDQLFTDVTDLAGRWGSRGAGAPSSQNPSQTPPATPIIIAPPTLDAMTAVNMLWMSALILALGSAGVIVVSKVVLAFLLALGPLFIMLALFPQTRGFFEGWLRTAAANALIPLFALASTAAMLPVVEPIVASAVESNARGLADVKPVFTLALASLIFGVLMFQIVAMTTRLAGAWRLPEARVGDDSSAPAGRVESSAAVTPVDPRIVAMVSAVARDEGGATRSATHVSLATSPFFSSSLSASEPAAGRTHGRGKPRCRRRVGAWPPAIAASQRVRGASREANLLHRCDSHGAGGYAGRFR